MGIRDNSIQTVTLNLTDYGTESLIKKGNINVKFATITDYNYNYNVTATTTTTIFPDVKGSSSFIDSNSCCRKPTVHTLSSDTSLKEVNGVTIKETDKVYLTFGIDCDPNGLNPSSEYNNINVNINLGNWVSLLKQQALNGLFDYGFNSSLQLWNAIYTSRYELQADKSFEVTSIINDTIRYKFLSDLDFTIYSSLLKYELLNNTTIQPSTRYTPSIVNNINSLKTISGESFKGAGLFSFNLFPTYGYQVVDNSNQISVLYDLPTVETNKNTYKSITPVIVIGTNVYPLTSTTELKNEKYAGSNDLLIKFDKTWLDKVGLEIFKNLKLSPKAVNSGTVWSNTVNMKAESLNFEEQKIPYIGGNITITFTMDEDENNWSPSGNIVTYS